VVVTALDPDPRAGSVRVRLDGEPFATIAAEDAARLRLVPGAELDAARAAEVERCGDVFAVRRVAVRMLAGQALPRRSLVRRLVRKGHAPEIAEGVVAALEANGLIDDAEFARHFAATRATRRRHGPARLEADLRRLGVDRALAERAVAEALAREGLDTVSILGEAAERKLRELQGVAPAVRRRRLRAYLVRRGFTIGEIADYLRRR